MFFQQNKLLAFLLLLSILFSLFSIMIFSTQPPAVSARAAALYEPTSERFLYKKNGSTRLGMASTTKIMTALIAVEQPNLDRIVEIDDRAIGIEGSSLYLTQGARLSLRELVLGLMLRSANDAAAAIGYEIGGSIESFAELMNQRAAALQLHDTHFENPHGLDHKDHYTTACDLAKLTAYALKNPTFRTVVSTYKTTIGAQTGTPILLVNHNKMLRLYDGAIGVKTGYTKKCGRCLVSAAERDGLTMIAVTIDAPDDWNDHIRLLDLGYRTLENRHLCKIGAFSHDVPVVGGTRTSVKCSVREDLDLIMRRGDALPQPQIRLSRYAVAPVHVGDILGCVAFCQNGETVATLPIRATEDVDAQQEKHDRFFARLFDRERRTKRERT